MKPSTVSTLLLPLFALTTSADLVPAQLRAPAALLLGKRQFCDTSYPYTCSAIDGDAMCMAADEVCCQRIATDGTYPFVCDASHPYCCPSDNGVPQCGSDDSCGGSAFEPAPTQALATETTGAPPQATKAGGGKAPKSAAEGVRVGRSGGLAVAVLGVMAAL